MAIWKSIDPQGIQGRTLKGDTTASPTKWWNHLYQLIFSWRKVAVLSVHPQTAKEGFRIGYIPFSGNAKLLAKRLHSQQFRVRLGHEDVVFFAVNLRDEEIPLELINYEHRDHGEYQDAPLY